jgi:NAD dependent epimerase/dehydratase family enzyme
MESKVSGPVNLTAPNPSTNQEFTAALARAMHRPALFPAPGFALKLAKESVNQALEAQGQYTAMRAAFSLQHLGHANNKLRFGTAIDPSGL